MKIPRRINTIGVIAPWCQYVCVTLLWFGCSVFLSKAETSRGKDAAAVTSAAPGNAVTVPHKCCFTR